MKNIIYLLFVFIISQSIAVNAADKNTVKSFPPSRVRLLDSPFKRNMERNAAYLLSLDADRFLHNTRKYAGLKPKAELYGGWESRGVAGHSLGHYLTALSLQFAATGDGRFRQRIDYIISEMAECQKLYGDGYIGALPPVELATLRGFKSGKVEIDGNFGFKGGAWVPWYTQHKILNGLKDAWTLGGNVQAGEVALKLADWVDSITSDLTPEQQQSMLKVEFGGMSEVLIDLYALTKNERYLEASRRFYHRAILDPLLAGRDELPGKHANTQLPKIIGEARDYEVTGDPNGRKISEFFWRTVIEKYTFAIGGNSDREHFFPLDKASEHLGAQTAESCNTYNMLKLTGHLFEWNPKVEYGDYYERALYNHILASQEPATGMFTYFISLKPGHFRTYSSPDNSFWCCVGSGMENHTKYGEAIYFHGEKDLYVNLFIPSELDWKEQKIKLEQKTNYPESDQIEFLVKSASSAKPLTLLIRNPAWAAGALDFQLNGKRIKVESKPGEFTKLIRVWKKGDRLRVTVAMKLRTEPLPGAPNKVAFLYGPLVLAGDFGVVPKSETYPISAEHFANDQAQTANIPVLVADDPASLVKSLKRESAASLTFRTESSARPKQTVILRPFKDLNYNYYNVYWEVLASDSDWARREAEIEAKRKQQQIEDSLTVDYLRPGEPQSEIDHGLISEQSETGIHLERKWRHAQDGGFFEFNLKVLADTTQILRATYWGGETGNRKFDILVDGKLLATQVLFQNKPGEFFNVEYALPAELITGKKQITVRFQAHDKNMAGGLYYMSVMKK